MARFVFPGHTILNRNIPHRSPEGDGTRETIPAWQSMVTGLHYVSERSLFKCFSLIFLKNPQPLGLQPSNGSMVIILWLF